MDGGANAYKVTMQVQYWDPNTSGFSIDETFYSADIHSKRLTLWFNGSLEAELTLDGSVVGTSTAQSPFSWSSVLITVIHPYSWGFADQATWYTIWAGQYYSIAPCVGKWWKGAGKSAYAGANPEHVQWRSGRR
ncbi:MAG: hypothetical protein HC888_09260 [Candidatus Competibacteraceae bacterium]|nr:hypothetical protein [Candidatus Competibacteraceae bacterium]